MNETAPAYGIGLDTGGTFTDIVLFDLAARRIVRKAKTPTTHGHYAACVSEALRKLSLRGEEILALSRVVLSTTLATNAVAEDKVHPTGLLLEPADIRVPPGFHPRLALLRSQITFDAHEVVPVSREEVLAKAAPFAGEVEGFAVSGYAATRDPRHEETIAAVLAREFGKPVVLGSQLTHRLNFLQRARAAALNAGLLPVILEWLRAIQAILREHGVACPLYLVKGDGSLMSAEEAVRAPVHTLYSGPAASLQGGALLSGRREGIVIDMGGTTTDLGRLSEGMGRLREGGVRIDGRAIAVDGLDLATFGLGGDSRLRRLGDSGFRFASQRVLPFCRAAELHGTFSPEALERECAEHWHFGDLELLEMLALDSHQAAVLAPHLAAEVRLGEMGRAMLEALRGGPARERALARGMPPAEFQRTVSELLRLRAIVRIGFTPTDLFCAEGNIPGFSREHAQAMLALYARMADLAPEELSARLWAAFRRQVAEILIGFLAGLDPAARADAQVLERLAAMALGDGEPDRPRVELVPGGEVVLVGAGAPMMFARAPAGLRPWLVVPEHGDVANAVGAVASRFVWRESATLEPLRHGGVDLFDHHGKRPFATLAQGLAEARRVLEARLRARADAMGLVQPELRFREEVIEDYAEFSRRTRKEFVLARVEAVLTGMPG
jgi:N-methylhydantoinase A/oxoprolinase/acetone carboxylase beta subunit